MYEIGKTYIFSVPPGWLLGGTVADLTVEGEIVLKDAIWIEGINNGQSALGSVAFAATAKELNAAVATSHPLPDGFVIRREAALMASPCVRDLTPLSRSGDAQAIKKAAGK